MRKMNLCEVEKSPESSLWSGFLNYSHKKRPLGYRKGRYTNEDGFIRGGEVQYTL